MNTAVFNLIFGWYSVYKYLQGEKKKTKKTKTEKYWDWELTNETKPIWVSLLNDICPILPRILYDYCVL